MPLKLQKTCKALSAFLGSILILIIILAYSQYLTLKKTLISRISDKATALIGQKVEIGNIFLDSAAGITITEVSIKNPDNFIEGDFLRIKKIRFEMRYRELFKGRFSFRSIEVDSPELSLMIAEGKLNVADSFREFFLKKGTAEYLIDEFSSRNASFSFNNEPLYCVRNMNLSMNNLSSVQGARTSFNASLAYWDSNKMTVEGWAYLKDKAQKFSISVISDDINFSILREHISKYGVDLDKSMAGISFQAEGDTEQGLKIRAEAQLKTRGIFIFKKDTMNSMSLTTEAFLDMKKEALTISKAIFTVGDSSAIQAKGLIQGIFSSPSYSAEIRVSRLDLASFDLMKGLKASGIITSDLIQVKGTLSDVLPQAAGTMTISNGALSIDKADVQGLNAKLTFASERELSVTLGASARILRAGDALFRQPVEMKLGAEGKGKPGKIMFKSDLNLSGIDMDLKGKDVRAGHLNASYGGTVQGKFISGKASLEGKDLTYDTYKARNLKTDLVLDYNGKNVTMKNVRTVSDIFSAAGEMITLTLPQGMGKIIMEAKNLSASYPDKKAALKGLDCMVSMPGKVSDLSGDLSFTAQQVSFQDISSGPIVGKGSIANGEFSIDIPSAKLFEGSTSIFAKGRSAGSPFPIALTLTAENIDLGSISHAAKLFFKTPYAASGSAQVLSFDGTISSPESITGRASIRGKNISITNVENKALLKDVIVSSDIVFRGRDADIKADFNVANLALSLSGSAVHFLEDGRTLRMSLLMPEVRISEIRTAFWDIVPDRLLYAGLNGSLAVNLLTTYSRNAITADGAVLLRDIAIEGENSEYSLGPINGMLPVHFTKEFISRAPSPSPSPSGGEGNNTAPPLLKAPTLVRGGDEGEGGARGLTNDRLGNSAGNERNALSIPSFERTDFDELKKTFAGSKHLVGNEIKIGSVRYGFRLLEDISLWVEQKGSSLKINRISAKMFGGKVNGTGFVDLSDGLSYRAGVITDGVSLTQLCEDIPPIKGYISGRIDGIAAIKGSGAGLTNITGKADFWTYSTEGEKTRISKEFLEKIGGPQVKAYLGERPFSKGILGLYIRNGFLIFKELEISNRNLIGITDLSVKVAPLNNRIAIDHLMWTITEAAQRAKKE